MPAGARCLNWTVCRRLLAAVLPLWLASTTAWPAQPEAEAEAEELFAVTEYRVLGNSVLPGVDIETLLYPLLGTGKSIKDVEAARQALEAMYRDRGFGAIYVDIPEQRVAQGVVRLRVTEGRLEHVHITGARYYSNRRIVAALPALQPGTVLNLPVLQQQLTRLNQQAADRQITPVLKPGDRQGLVDVELRVSDSLPVHASAEVNNRYTANTTETRLSLNASYDNLFQRFHSLAFQYQTSPEKPEEVRVLALTYLAPLARSGNVLAFYGVDTNSDFAAAGGNTALAILGTGRIYGARYVMRLPTSGGSQTLSFGADYKQFRDNIELPGGTTDSTPIRYVGWSAAYSGNWRSMGDRQVATTSAFNLSANFGLRGVVNDTTAFEYKRFKARANYWHLRSDWQREQPLFAGSTLFVRAAGQWTDQSLISNEQFAIGGADSVRGYLESEQLGDLGISGTLEWRTPSAHRWLGNWAKRAIVAVFYDAGLLRVNDPLPDAAGTLISQYQLASAGIGLRLEGLGGLVGALDWAVPQESGEHTLKGESRMLFQFRYGL